MHLEKIEIRGFGKLNSLSLSFVRGFNLIFGQNEAGKSTLQMFLKGMLYGLKGGRAGKDGSLPPLKRYKPWIGEEYAGFLEYRLDNGNSYRIGRNFAAGSVRVFDSLYNDISNTFEISRERGPLFAEKHLGTNEGCFDRTVFIRQMETRIDDSGSKELMDRLGNITQTGLEDVSFQKAQEALKDALKIHVGNDKTIRRPMDRTLARIEELKAERKICVEKNESLLVYEQGLKEAIVKRDGLETKKLVFLKAREILGKRQFLKNMQHVQGELEKLLERLNYIDDERNSLSKSVQEYGKLKEQLAPFSELDNGLPEDIEVEYERFINSREDIRNQQRGMDLKLQSFRQLQVELEPMIHLSQLESSVEEKVATLENELAELQQEYENSSPVLTDENLNQVRFRQKIAKYNIFLGGILSAVSVGIAFINFAIGTVLSGVMLLLTAVAAALTIRFSKKVDRLVKEKSSDYISINSLVGEIKRKQSELEQIFRLAGVRNAAEFFRMKAIFDSKTQECARLKRELGELEDSLSECKDKAAALQKKILNRLVKAGIQEIGDMEIHESKIRDFKQGMQQYQALGPGMQLSFGRMEDLQRETDDLFERASALCKTKIHEKTDILLFLGGTEQRLDTIKLELERELEDARGLYLANGMDSCEAESCLERLMEGKPEDVEFWIDHQLEELGNASREVILKIREFETLIKAFGEDEDTIQKLDEEIYALESTKKKLEDMDFALKTALDLLTEASQEIQRDFAPALNSRMSYFVRALTGGKYCDVRADDNLNLKVQAPETGDIVNTGVLSGGTADQMYLAMRLGMAQLLASEEEKLPLIMDEVLAQYDDIRTRQALEFFKELSRDTQILFFTCKSREVDVAREVYGDALNIIELKA